MISRRSRAPRLLIVALAAAMLLGLGAPAARAELVNATGGKSVLKVDLNSVRALGQDNIFTVILPPATIGFQGSNPIATFPITGGTFDTDTMLGTVNLGGGIRIVKYNAEFTVIEAQLDVTNLKIFNSNTLLGDTMGLIPGPAADLLNDTHTENPDGSVHHEADMATNEVGALILNTYFSTDVFQGGMVLGHLTSDIQTDRFPGYARPQGASRARVPLTVAYEECTAPDLQHGPGLEHPSCSSPSQRSGTLTVGTMDANGHAPQFNGSVGINVCNLGTTVTGVCSTPAGMTMPDVRLDASLTDVRCVAAGEACEGGANSDYTGELQVQLPLRITDRSNGPSGGPYDQPGTVADSSFGFTVPCQANAGGDAPEAVGASCSVVTSANTLIAGYVQSGKRAIWQLEQVEVYDGGPDGQADTVVDNTVFATQGVFVP